MNNYKLLKHVLTNIRQDMSDEDLMHSLIEEKLTVEKEENLSFGDKAADKLAQFAGSWFFIISFTALLIAWIVINLILLKNPYDPYPFVLLNLLLSCIAAVQAPLIMMSQKRQEEKDRARAENDFKVNLKSEIVLEDLHRKLDYIIEYINNTNS